MPADYAYGFVNLAHLFSEKLEDVSVPVITEAITLSAAEHTRQVNGLMAALVEPTLLYKERYQLPSSFTLQPLDEHGVPRPVMPAGYFDVAYPIRGGGLAWGSNRVARALQTVEDVNRMVIESFRADADWMRRHIVASLYNNVAWTFSDPEHGNLSIKPLANNDTDKYPVTGGTVAADNHYLFQAAAIADGTNPFPTIHDELMEHPTNVGPVVVYTPTNLVSTIEALTNFVPITDPDITVGIASDRVTGGVPAIGFGDEVLGKTDKCWIVEWKFLPDNYMIAHASGVRVLKMRQYPAASLQGLFPEFNDVNGALQESRLIRYAGFGAANRIGALVYRVGTGSYAIPSGYAEPLAA